MSLYKSQRHFGIDQRVRDFLAEQERNAAKLAEVEKAKPSCPPCNQNCRQGRDCPARQACELADNAAFAPTLRMKVKTWIAIAVGLALSCAAAGFFLASMFERTAP